MKKCPNCDRTFDDNMRFCQTDGTPLVEAGNSVQQEDPYKTTVGRQEDIASAIPPDPFKTMVAGPPKKDDSDDLLQLPDEQDLLRTQYVSDEEMKREMSADDPVKEEIIEVPPLNDFSSSSSDKGAKDSPFNAPVPPKFNEPDLSAPNFGERNLNQQTSGSPKEDFPKDIPSPFSEPSSRETSSPFDQKPGANEPKSPFDSQPFSPPGTPIPSPFGGSSQPPFEQQNTPLPPQFKEAEIQAEALNTPFAEQINQQSQPLQQTEWTPPPAPDANWQNQEIGANTPFQPPAAGTSQNQTLAIVSLVLGILSLLCCAWFLPGIAAVILGFMAKSKAEQNPNEFGGRGLALGGIITGGISVVLGIIVMILYLFTGALAGLGGF